MMDAARITPYPFVVHQVPDNPSKKKRQRSRPSPPDDQPRFNTGPVRHPPSTARRLARNAIPDYPPPTFQEAINTEPFSQSSLSLATAPLSSVPDDSPEEQTPRPIHSVPRMEIDPINDLTPLEDTSESDDSALVIINKNEVPVCSTDFPPTKHESKKDWFKRRKNQEPPALPSTSSLYKKLEDPSRGRNLPRITIPINPDPSGLSPEDPPSSPKRRFLSLSPIKTIFPSKNQVMQDRPFTATISSPSSPQSSLGNKNFFRSATSLSSSLSASSLLRLPGSQKSNSLSRRLFTHKGKERASEPVVVHENLQDNWEVVDRTAGADSTVRVHPEDHPQSLMSVVMDSFSANGSTTTFLRNSPTHTKSRSVTPSDESHPTSNNNNSDAPPQITQTFSDQQSRTDDTPQTSLSPTPLARTPTSSQPPTSHRPPESPAALLTSQSPHGTTTDRDIPRTSVPALVPTTTTDHGHKDPAAAPREENLPPPLVPVSVWSPASSPAASRSIPDLLTDVPTDLLLLPSSSHNHNHHHHHHAVCSSCGTTHNNPSFNKSVPMLHMYPGAYRASSTPPPPPPSSQLLTSKTPALEDSTRSHYAGRPLPRPPPSFPDVQPQPAMMMPSVLNPASGNSAQLQPPSSENTHGKKGKEKEGLLIDLEDTSLDSTPPPPPHPSTTTIVAGRSDESRYHSQVYLPLLPASSSAAMFSRDPELLLDLPYPSSSSSSTMMPGAHLPACAAQHRYGYQQQQQQSQSHSQHRFVYPSAQFSKSHLDLSSRQFIDGLGVGVDARHHHHLFPREAAGARCCPCEHHHHAVGGGVPWATPPAVAGHHHLGSAEVPVCGQQPVCHHLHHHHPLAVDSAQRQRHHLAHLSY